MWEMRNAYNILVRKPGGKRPHGRRGRSWEDNIGIDIMKIGGRVRTGFNLLRIGTNGGLL
jgi:hypothetical protein